MRYITIFFSLVLSIPGIATASTEATVSTGLCQTLLSSESSEQSLKQEIRRELKFLMEALKLPVPYSDDNTAFAVLNSVKKLLSHRGIAYLDIELNKDLGIEIVPSQNQNAPPISHLAQKLATAGYRLVYQPWPFRHPYSKGLSSITFLPSDDYHNKVSTLRNEIPALRFFPIDLDPKSQPILYINDSYFLDNVNLATGNFQASGLTYEKTRVLGPLDLENDQSKRGLLLTDEYLRYNENAGKSLRARDWLRTAFAIRNALINQTASKTDFSFWQGRTEHYALNFIQDTKDILEKTNRAHTVLFSQDIEILYNPMGYQNEGKPIIAGTLIERLRFGIGLPPELESTYLTYLNLQTSLQSLVLQLVNRPAVDLQKKQLVSDLEQKAQKAKSLLEIETKQQMRLHLEQLEQLAADILPLAKKFARIHKNRPDKAMQLLDKIFLIFASAEERYQQRMSSPTDTSY